MDVRRGPGPADRGPSPLSVGLQWASTITSVGLEMALPPLLGVWLDRKFGTGPLWTIVFSALGFFVAMRHLWQIAKRLGGGPAKNRPAGQGRGTP